MTRPLRGGLIGFGFIAENGHAPAYLARGGSHGDLELGAIADGCPARQQHARRCFPTLPVYPDAKSLLADRSLDLDFVDIAVPPCDHVSIAHAALDRGLHVLCEKPLGTEPDAVRRLLAHAERARRVVFPCHNYKHAPVIKAVQAALASGAVGSVERVTLQTFRPTHARGVPEWRPDWRRERCIAGGGIGMDHGAHTFYLACEWLGSTPLSVTATTRSRPEHDTEEDFVCTVTFPTGMVNGYLTWGGGVRKVLYTLHGERGAIRVEDDDLEVTRRDPAAPNGWRVERTHIASEWMDASHAAWFTSLFGDFLTAVQEQQFVGHEARQALACVELISAAYASARQGSRVVALEPDRAAASARRAAPEAWAALPAAELSHAAGAGQ
jgi:predicted dehydrogenase